MTPMRWFAVLVGLFGVLCVLYAWFAYGAYNMLDGIFGRKPSLEFAADVAALRVNLKTAIGLYAASALVAFASAIGFYFDHPWAKRLWLGWCSILLLIYLIELYPDPSKWSEHLELLLAAPISWWALRNAERKTQVES